MNPDNRAVTFVTALPTRSVHASSVTIFAAMFAVCVLGGAGTAEADVPNPLQQFGRMVGAGWGDGYHACKCSGFRPLADLPPRPYCYGDCGAPCSHATAGQCSDCQTGGIGACGQVCETGLTLRANASQQCRPKGPSLGTRFRLGMFTDVCETGLAIKAPGVPFAMPTPCDLPPVQRPIVPQLATPLHCDATCDVNPTLSHQSPHGGGYPAPSLSRPMQNIPQPPTSPAAAVEIPADSAMNQTLPLQKQTPSSLRDPVPTLASEPRIAVTELGPPQAQRANRHPVRIAQGNHTSTLPKRVEVTDAIPADSQGSDSATLSLGKQNHPTSEDRRPSRLPTIR
ncbi:hypothetical protein [Novipirellula galeiformis]|nr:hypothetical protein [Novipirellula galeiformis]